jgi:hypothetical protein
VELMTEPNEEQREFATRVWNEFHEVDSAHPFARVAELVAARDAARLDALTAERDAARQESAIRGEQHNGMRDKFLREEQYWRDEHAKLRAQLAAALQQCANGAARLAERDAALEVYQRLETTVRGYWCSGGAVSRETFIEDLAAINVLPGHLRGVALDPDAPLPNEAPSAQESSGPRPVPAGWEPGIVGARLDVEQDAEALSWTDERGAVWNLRWQALYAGGIGEERPATAASLRERIGFRRVTVTRRERDPLVLDDDETVANATNSSKETP